jgi:hypothetical protein
VRVTIVPDKDALSRLPTGEEFEDDGVKHRSLATISGEEIPGVRLERAAPDRFGITPSSD